MAITLLVLSTIRLAMVVRCIDRNVTKRISVVHYDYSSHIIKLPKSENIAKRYDLIISLLVY